MTCTRGEFTLLIIGRIFSLFYFFNQFIRGGDQDSGTGISIRSTLGELCGVGDGAEQFSADERNLRSTPHRSHAILQQAFRAVSTSLFIN